jgi:hypothetical protein
MKISTIKQLCIGLTFISAFSTHAADNDMMKHNTTLRIATFNVSMEALNYVPYERGIKPNITGDELHQALVNNHPQIRNIAEIIQRVNPDIILLNEFDNTDDNHTNAKLFLNNYLAKSQQGQSPIEYRYFFQGDVNTGVVSPFDLNHDGVKGQLPEDGYGYGFFPGHFGMLLLSKYPIDTAHIRTFQHFKWADMPNALQTIDPETKQPWYDETTWQQLRLSSKSHWDIPINVQGEWVHILASHPTPPVFDGPEDRNGKRNHDEIRFWADYIEPEKSGYIYDDTQRKGGLAPWQRFVIMGDQNASVLDGDAIKSGIGLLLSNPLIQDANPSSEGGKKADNPHAAHHTAHWGMRADYVLPSTLGFTITGSGIFWPTPKDATYRLVENRQASSDHRLVWLDLTLTPINH